MADVIVDVFESVHVRVISLECSPYKSARSSLVRLIHLTTVP